MKLTMKNNGLDLFNLSKKMLPLVISSLFLVGCATANGGTKGKDGEVKSNYRFSQKELKTASNEVIDIIGEANEYVLQQKLLLAEVRANDGFGSHGHDSLNAKKDENRVLPAQYRNTHDEDLKVLTSAEKRNIVRSGTSNNVGKVGYKKIFNEQGVVDAKLEKEVKNKFKLERGQEEQMSTGSGKMAVGVKASAVAMRKGANQAQLTPISLGSLNQQNQVQNQVNVGKPKTFGQIAEIKAVPNQHYVNRVDLNQLNKPVGQELEKKVNLTGVHDVNELLSRLAKGMGYQYIPPKKKKPASIKPFSKTYSKKTVKTVLMDLGNFLGDDGTINVNTADKVISLEYK